MNRVPNRKVIRRLSYRTMKEKGKKNLIAILAIALTSLMFTALFTVGMSILDSMQESTMRQVGTRAHSGFKYMTMEEYNQVKGAPGIWDISYNIIVGFGQNPELYGTQTEVRFSEDKSAEWGFCKPDVGTMPRSGLECATSTKVLDALSIPHEIGSKIAMLIQIGEETVAETFTLVGYWEEEGTVFAEEFWVSKEWQEKHAPTPQTSYTDHLLAGGAGFNGYIDVSIMLASTYDIEEKNEKIIEWSGLDKASTYGAVNWAYITAGVDVTSVILVIMILSIIILSGYLIIYNIFYINVTTDIRYYGLLKTVGTTGRQLRRLVRGQAFMLAAIGIPLGLLAGWFVGKGILPVLYKQLNTGGITNIIINPWIFIGSAVFSLIVVYISCIKPCSLAVKVSPIEAVRFVEQMPHKKKNKKTYKKINMFRMAAANMGRSKKKAAIVILSLSLCMVLLNSTYSLVTGFDFDKYVSNYLVGDYLIRPLIYVDFSKGENNTDSISEFMIKEVKQIAGEDSVFPMYQKDSRIYLSDKSLKEFVEYTERNEDNLGHDSRFWSHEVDMAKENGEQHAMIYGVPEGLIEHLNVLDGKIDSKLLKAGKYVLLINRRELSTADRWVNAGDVIKLEENGDELTVMAVVDLPMGMSAQYGTGFFSSDIIVDVEQFPEAARISEGYSPRGALHLVIDVEEGKEADILEKLSSDMEKYNDKLKIVSKESLREEFSSLINLFALVGGLLCFILGMIGILNFTNAVITGILARKQEFAMMESIGMTGKQLSMMLIGEGLIYALWSIIITATVGNLIGYFAVQTIGSVSSYFTWHFTVFPILCSVPVLLLLSMVIPFISYRFMCKSSIIERLRMAEV